MDRFILILLAIALVMAGITYLLGRFVPKIKALKYLPGILCLIMAIYLYYLARFVRAGEGFEDLANFVMAIMFLTGSFSGLITAFGLGLAARNKKSK